MAISVEPVSQNAFAPFGRIIQHANGAVIADAGSAFIHEPRATQPVLEWVHLTQKIALPLRVDQLEQHPFSAQTFLPHSNSPYLVVVCPSLADGSPDITGTRAFEMSPTLGVTFAAKVWHRSLAPLVAPSAFVMAMMRTGDGNDTVIRTLDVAIEINAQNS
jgi:ureidoglycolate lyase